MPNRTCPYCMSPIEEREEAAICVSCGAAHHHECWDENRGCCVKGCREVTRALDIDVPPDESEKLVLTRESVESARPHRAAAVSNPCVRCGRQVPEGELHCAECSPRIEESADAKNVGPILIMLAVLGVLLAWMVIVLVPSSQPPESAATPAVTD